MNCFISSFCRKCQSKEDNSNCFISKCLVQIVNKDSRLHNNVYRQWTLGLRLFSWFFSPNFFSFYFCKLFCNCLRGLFYIFRDIQYLFNSLIKPIRMYINTVLQLEELQNEVWGVRHQIHFFLCLTKAKGLIDLVCCVVRIYL